MENIKTKFSLVAFQVIFMKMCLHSFNKMYFSFNKKSFPDLFN